MIKVWHVETYRKATENSHLEKSLKHSCLNAQLADIVGDTVYFRNYEDTTLEYIEFCFTRLGRGKARLNYVSYVEWNEDMIG